MKNKRITLERVENKSAHICKGCIFVKYIKDIRDDKECLALEGKLFECCVNDKDYIWKKVRV